MVDDRKKARKQADDNGDDEKDQNLSDNVPTADSTANLGPSNPY